MYPHFKYCITSWGKTNTKTFQPLTTTQKKVFQIMTNSSNTTRSDPLLTKLQLLKLNDIYKFQLAITMYNISNKIWNIDSQTQPIISINSIHKHQTRLVKQNNYHLHLIRTNLGKSIITFGGPKIWNEIPKHIKYFKNINLKNIKNFYSIYTTNFFICVYVFFLCVLLFLFFCCCCCCFGFIICLHFRFVYIFNM